MAAKISCMNCRRTIRFNDREPILSPYCSVRCEREHTGVSEDDVIDDLDPKDVEKARRLIALAINKGATDGESANAARAACQIIARSRILDARRASGRR